MELREYLILVRRWLWLLILGLVLGLGAGYGVSRLQTPVFQAETKILVIRAPDESVSNLSSLSDQQLVQTFTQLLVTRPVLEAASQTLDIRVQRNQVGVRQLSGTQIIEVLVEDSDPQRAADIANILVQVLIDQNEVLQSSRFASSEESLQAQLAEVEDQIASLQTEFDKYSEQSLETQQQKVEEQISALQAQIDELQQEIVEISYPDTGGLFQTPTPSLEERVELAKKQEELSQLNNLLRLYQQIQVELVIAGEPTTGGRETRLEQLQTTMALYQQIYSELLSDYETVRLARLRTSPSVVQVEEASPPSEPVRPHPVTNTALGGVVGLMLATGIAFFIEYLDNTIRTPEDVTRVLGLPVLGFIPDMGRVKKDLETQVFAVEQPHSIVAETFRSLVTNLALSWGEKPPRAILVTSPGPGEGRTMVAVNLAATLARGGRRVMLVDGDLRSPGVHQLLGIQNETGLSDAIKNDLILDSVAQVLADKGLRVVTGGSQLENPAEVLGSIKLLRVLALMREKTDVAIFDSPSFLVVDPLILASMLEAVLIVIIPGRTRAAAALAMMEQLERTQTKVLGVVFNRIPRSVSTYTSGQVPSYRQYPGDQVGIEAQRNQVEDDNKGER